VYVLEVNPRASRTVPYVSKAIGAPLAKIAARAMAGISLKSQAFEKEIIPPYFSVKEGRPHIVDMIKNGDIDFIVNVVEDKKAVKDSYAIRAEALARRVVYFTTLAGALAACMGMRHGNALEVYSLQSLHQRLH
jgi:carbamoyl-phosphate synthase large subunit